MNSKLPVTVDVVDTRSLSREKLYNTSHVSSTSLQESRLSTVVSWINIRSIGQKKTYNINATVQGGPQTWRGTPENSW